MTNKKYSEPTTKLNQFELAAAHNIANQVFVEYFNITKQRGQAPEPEHFVEQWVTTCVMHPTRELLDAVWHYFMCNLKDQRDSKRR